MFSQTVAIGYKQLHPDSVVVVKAFDPRPSLLIKASESSNSFRRYGFVDAIQELDPSGALGLLDPDFKVVCSLCLMPLFASFLFVQVIVIFVVSCRSVRVRVF